MVIKRIIIVLAHTVVGRALCGASTGIGIATISLYVCQPSRYLDSIYTDIHFNLTDWGRC